MADGDKIKRSDFVVKSKVKVLLKEAEMKASAEIWEQIGHEITRSVKMAINRAKANKRKTVKASDF